MCVCERERESEIEGEKLATSLKFRYVVQTVADASIFGWKTKMLHCYVFII